MVFTAAIEKGQGVCFGLADADLGCGLDLAWRWDGYETGYDLCPYGWSGTGRATSPSVRAWL